MMTAYTDFQRTLPARYKKNHFSPMVCSVNCVAIKSGV